MVRAAALAFLMSGILLAQSSSGLSPERRALFGWLDRVAALPSLRAGEFVRVTYTQRNSSLRIGHEFGFITSERSGQLDILMLDLRTSARPWREDGRLEAVVVERWNLRATAEKAAGPVASGDVRLADNVMLGTLELVMLARAAAEAGWMRLADDLMVTAGRASRDGLLSDLRDDIASRLAIRAYRMLESGAPRDEVRNRLKQLVDDFPEFDDADIARRSITRLDETIARASPTTANTTEAVTERVARLIDALVDENAVWAISPGRVYFFANDPRETPVGPVRELWSLGHVGVPQLIEALDDRRLTRAVYWRNSRGWPVEVGEVALQILEQISGQRFAFDDSVKDRVTKWWNTVKK